MYPMSEDSGELKTRVIEWLVRGGFRVEEPSRPLPPGADWGLDIYTPPPTLRLHLVHIAQRRGLVVGIGIGFSQEHLKGIMSLKDEDRVRLSASMMARILSVCPYCRISLQPSPNNPERVIVELGILDEALTAQGLVEAIVRLVNTFIAVNTILWERFPSVISKAAERTSETTYM